MNSKVGFWSGLPLYGNRRSVLIIDTFRESVVHWPEKYYSRTQTCISVVHLICESVRFFSILSSFLHPYVHLWGSLAYFTHSCTQTWIWAVHLIRASFRRALNIRRLGMIVDNHLISLFNDSLVYIYYDFSQFSKAIQYARSFSVVYW